MVKKREKIMSTEEESEEAKVKVKEDEGGVETLLIFIVQECKSVRIKTD